jgi:hypothetical protein
LNITDVPLDFLCDGFHSGFRIFRYPVPVVCRESGERAMASDYPPRMFAVSHIENHGLSWSRHLTKTRSLSRRIEGIHLVPPKAFYATRNNRNIIILQHIHQKHSKLVFYNPRPTPKKTHDGSQ